MNEAIAARVHRLVTLTNHYHIQERHSLARHFVSRVFGIPYSKPEVTVEEGTGRKPGAAGRLYDRSGPCVIKQHPVHRWGAAVSGPTLLSILEKDQGHRSQYSRSVARANRCPA